MFLEHPDSGEVGEVVGQKRDLGEVTLGILRWVSSWSKTRENREKSGLEAHLAGSERSKVNALWGEATCFKPAKGPEAAP